jgi:L-asparaginase II
MVTTDDFAPIAVTTRNGFDESVHFGAMVGLHADGSIAFAVGNPSAAIYPRSSNKPMQALAMLRAGLDVPAATLAVVCASHDGTAEHLAVVRELLAAYGLTPAHLGNTASYPLDEAAATFAKCAGEPRSPLFMNCSGKHAGMLATCVVNGWSLDDYLDVHHPLQRAITATIDEVAGEPHAHIGVDGCGAPAHVLSVIGLARSFRTIATGLAGPEGERVHAAMTSQPQLVGGVERDVTLLMRDVPFLMAKDGADGVYAAALPDGRALALKVADGGDRARPPVFLAGLARLGIDVSGVDRRVCSPILGHGRPVGVIRPLV